MMLPSIQIDFEQAAWAEALSERGIDVDGVHVERVNRESGSVELNSFVLRADNDTLHVLEVVDSQKKSRCIVLMPSTAHGSGDFVARVRTAFQNLHHSK